MVTVVATQELKPGDWLRRFKEKAAQDEPRRGNDNNRLVVVSVGKLSPRMGCFSLLCCFFLLLFSSVHVCALRVMIMIYTAFLVMFSILEKVTALACCYLSLRDGNVSNVEKARHTTKPIPGSDTKISYHRAKTCQHKKYTPDPIASVLGAFPG